MREIQTGEVTKQFSSGLVVCQSCISFIGKQTKSRSFSAQSYSSHKSFLLIAPPDTLVSGQTLFPNRILLVLGIGANPKIGTPIVKPIPILMVNHFPEREPENKPVHQYLFARNFCCGKDIARAISTTCKPFETIYNAGITFIYNGLLTVCKGNSYHGSATKKVSSASPARLKPDCRVAARAEDKEVQKNAQPLFLRAWVFSFFRFILTSIPARVSRFNLITFYEVMLPQER